MVRILFYLAPFFALCQPTIEPIPNQSNYGIALSFDITDNAEWLAVSTKFGQVFSTNLLTNERSTTPIIDIENEVFPSGEQGLLDINIQGNRIYTLYCVKRQFLFPEATSNSGASIIKVRYFEVDFESNTIVNDSTIIGNTLANGIPILNSNHVGGTLEFMSDGSLLISTGTVNSAPYISQAVNDGIVSGTIANGYYKAQQLSFLGGKILRVNPENGEAMTDNPFYPSKVYMKGLRNPFRMSLHNDVLYVGDVGESKYESIKVGITAGTNLGFPYYEGIEPYLNTQSTLNPDTGTSFLNSIIEAQSYSDTDEWQVQKASYGYGRFSSTYSKVNNYNYIESTASEIATGISVVVGVVSQQFNDKLLFSDYFLNKIYMATLENSYISDVELLIQSPVNSIVKYKEHPITKDIWFLTPSNGLYRLYNNTLGVDNFTQECVNCYKQYYNLLGQLINFETAPSSIYIEQTLKEGFIVKSQKVIKK